MKKYCSITVDIDSIDCYYKAYGLKIDDKRNIIYRNALPRILDIFEEFNIKATFFVIGKDLKTQENKVLIKSIFTKGHEIANHSMNHILRFASLDKEKKKEEISQSEEVIEDLIGENVAGFRVPGWDIDCETMDILEERGYLYDSSIIPSYLLPLFKIIYKLKKMGSENTATFGRNIYCFSPITPYFSNKGKIWKRGNRALLEIPMTVTPLFRIPFYGTFLFTTGINVFKLSYWLIKKANIHFLNYQLHPIELVDLNSDNIDPGLIRLPSMKFPLEEKQQIYRIIFKNISKEYEFITLKELALKYSGGKIELNGK